MHEPLWHSVTIVLEGIGLNRQTTVYFRWVLKSDDYFITEQCGFYIDNIDIGY